MPLGKGLSSLIPSRQENAAIMAHASDRVWQIPISEIVPNPHQPRKTMKHDEMEDLIASMKSHGILEPLIVSELADGAYEMIAGHRRLQAATYLGLATVPCVVRVAKEHEKLEIALIENVQRSNLNAMEEAFAYKRLFDEFGLTHEEIAKRVGKQRSTVSNMLRLLDLPEEIQKALVEEKINISIAKALMSLPTHGEQLRMFRSMIHKEMNLADVTDAVGRAAEHKGFSRKDPLVMDFEKRLRERLATRVGITEKGGKGNIKISFYSREELNGVLKKLLGE
ncbi:MAG: ParB/RepB/Spo0J family partition protein [Candidatus Magasanikbacteria bacterium]|nr:ParB/RepB/Spo0J family partition protein [Candidatus Magasanikbacteria bacterium]